MRITQSTRDEIAKLVQKGYTKGFAKDGDDTIIIWELDIRLDR